MNICFIILSLYRNAYGRLLAINKPNNNIKDEVALTETKLKSKEERFNEFYVTRLTDNDERKVVLCRSTKEMEELLFTNLNHCIVAPKSFVTEILRQRELQAQGIELPLMDIEDLKKNLLSVYRRANRYVFPIDSDPNFLISVDYCFVEPEINEQDAMRKGRQKRANYLDILGCLETDETIKRILILGEFGSGKNTLCARIVTDIMNQEFGFLEKKLDMKLYITCDLSKFLGWDITKSLDDILLKFCHSYSTNNRLESTKKLIQQNVANILCIFSGYEHLPTFAKEKVNFVLNRENRKHTVFGEAIIVLATTTDPAFTPCFLTYFQKFFVLSRINQANVDAILQKLFEDNIEEKNAFVQSMKKMYLSFLLEISPLVLIYTVYVYKQYGARDRNQFVIELVYLMKDNEKDNRSFHYHREHIAKLLARTSDSLPNMWGHHGGFNNQKASECYEYLTNRRQTMVDIETGSVFAKRSTVFNIRSSNFDHNIDTYNQQLVVQTSFSQNFNKIYNMEKQNFTAMNEFIHANYYKNSRTKWEIENMESIPDTYSQFWTYLVKYLSKVEVLRNDYTVALISYVVRDLKNHGEDFIEYIKPLRVSRNLSQTPIAFYAMFYVFRRFGNQPPNERVFLRDVYRELVNMIWNPLDYPKLGMHRVKLTIKPSTPTERKTLALVKPMKYNRAFWLLNEQPPFCTTVLMI